MQIEIQALNIPLTGSLREYIKRRLYFALSTRDEHVHRVSVRLSDVNGPKGGKDMCCQVQVALKRQSNVVIKDVAEDIHTAIDRAAGRVGRTVARQLSRKTWRSRHPFLRGKTHFHSNEPTTGELLA